MNGDEFPSCLAIGYFSSAYVVQCGGQYREDDHCGTFVELHRAQSTSGGAEGRATPRQAKVACDVACNERILSQVCRRVSVQNTPWVQGGQLALKAGSLPPAWARRAPLSCTCLFLAL